MCEKCNNEYEDLLYDREPIIKLWEVLVPTVMDHDEHGGPNTRPIKTRYHRVFDAKVREIAGGLSIYKPLIGEWKHDETLYRERMIPVRIRCSEAQIREIGRYACDYYKQLAILVYEVSDNTFLIEKE